MSNNHQTFSIQLNGSSYLVETSNKSFSIRSQDGYRIITNEFGDCNPLESLWNNWKYQSIHGAAQSAMEFKFIKDAVILQIEQHLQFCLQIVEEEGADNLYSEFLAEKAASERKAQERAVQVALSRKMVEDSVSETLKLVKFVDGSIEFDGTTYKCERNTHGTVTIHGEFLSAAEKLGITKQAKGLFYSQAQKLASQNLPK